MEIGEEIPVDTINESPQEVPMETDDNDQRNIAAEDEDDMEDAAEQDQVFQETLIDKNVAVEFAPGEGQKPLSLLYDKNCEELAFPHIYCGHARNPNPDMKISYKDMVKWELQSCDRRAAEPEHVLFVNKKAQLEQIGSCMRTHMRKAAQTGLTAEQARNGDTITQEVNKDNAFRWMAPITGSPAYWEQQKKNVMAMMRQLGLCTFFITLSAAETHWKELLQILMKNLHLYEDKDVNDLTFEEKSQLIQKDPVTCALYFDHRFKEVQKTWKKTTEGPFGKYRLRHSYHRIEFQHRGSPHVHMLCWLEGAPKFDINNRDNWGTITEFIDSIITTDSSIPEVKDFVKFQHHKCTRTCYKRSHGKKICRFGAPFPPMDNTTILTPLTEEEKANPPPHISGTEVEHNRQIIKKMNEILESNAANDFQDFLAKLGCTYDEYERILRSQLRTNKVFIKRSVKDTRINAFSPKILMSMQSNMDIQFVLDAFACVSYIVEYINKPGRGISKMMHACLQSVRNGNYTILEQLKKLGSCLYNGTEISAQESAWCRLQLAMSWCSVVVEFVNTSEAKTRTRMLKPTAVLDDLDPEDTNVFVTGALERYINRPSIIEHLCYADFVALYSYKGNPKKKNSGNNDDDSDKSSSSEDETEQVDPQVDPRVGLPKIIQLRDENGKKCGVLKLRKVPKVLRFCRFNIKKDPMNYFREKLMLFKPWRNEEIELINIDHERVFLANKELIIENSKKYFAIKEDINLDELLIEVEQAHESDEPESFADQADPTHVNVYDYNEDEVQPNIMFDLGYEQVTTVEAKQFVIPKMLTDDSYYDLCDSMNIKQGDYLMHLIDCVNNKEIVHHFISGGAGVGKSRLIKAIVQTLLRIFGRDAGEAGLPEIIVCAHTGKAAHNVGGMTIHHAFDLNFTCGRKGADKLLPLNPNKLNSMRTKLAKLKFVIIDEISMVGSRQFTAVNERLNQITGIQDGRIFGDRSIIVVGDFNQLPPIKDRFVYESATNNEINELVTQNPLWERFLMFELIEIMRQKDDLVFAEALNRLAVGKCTDADEELFKGRSFTENSLPTDAKSAIRLMYENVKVDNYNKDRAKQLRKKTDMYADSKAKDQVINCTNERERARALFDLPNKHHRETQGLPYELALQENVNYMVTSNISVEDGLFNGATGVLKYILKDQSGAPTIVFLEFADPMMGKETRRRHRNVFQRNPNIKENWTPIYKLQLSFTTTGRYDVKVNKNKNSRNLCFTYIIFYFRFFVHNFRWLLQRL